MAEQYDTDHPAPSAPGPEQSAPVEGFSSADTADIARMSYEQARAELVETVARLENGGAGLEESLALWERGEALANRCQSWLDGARQRLEQVRAQTQPEGPAHPDGPSGQGVHPGQA